MLTYDYLPMLRYPFDSSRIPSFLDTMTSRTFEDYPPYNIEADTKHNYRITISAAGFTLPELSIFIEGRTLVIAGIRKESKKQENFVHRGIVGKDFKLYFDLEEHTLVNNASIENGLLTINLKQEVPEKLRPKSVEIRPGAPFPIGGVMEKITA